MTTLRNAALPLAVILMTTIILTACQRTRCCARSCNTARQLAPQAPPSQLAPPMTVQPAPPIYVSPPALATEPAPPPSIINTQALYASRCAQCHGARGEGGEKVPALIGPGALAKAPTLQALATYIQQTMPPEGMGPRLTHAEAHALASFAWKANGR